MRLFTIVEGQGEEAALPVLLRRFSARHGGAFELAGRPWRESRQRMLSEEHMSRVFSVARTRRADAALVILDSDDECAVALARRLNDIARRLMPDVTTSVVVAVREFEAWFLAGAESLRGQRGLPASLERPDAPESIRDAKGWLSRQMLRGYSPTLDQPALAASLSFDEASNHARSFRKLIKELTAFVENSDK